MFFFSLTSEVYWKSGAEITPVKSAPPDALIFRATLESVDPLGRIVTNPPPPAAMIQNAPVARIAPPFGMFTLPPTVISPVEAMEVCPVVEPPLGRMDTRPDDAAHWRTSDVGAPVNVPEVAETPLAPVTAPVELMFPVTLSAPVIVSPALLTGTKPMGLEVICFQLPEPWLRKVSTSPALVV